MCCMLSVNVLYVICECVCFHVFMVTGSSSFDDFMSFRLFSSPLTSSSSRDSSRDSPSPPPLHSSDSRPTRTPFVHHPPASSPSPSSLVSTGGDSLLLMDGLRDSQRRVYAAIMVSHALIVIGLSYRMAALLALHGTLCSVFFFFGMFFCVYSVWDLLLLLLLGGIRYMSCRMQFYMKPHAFTVPVAS
eukprot:GHVQ01010782.1.p1 GENE.GHVQ01010782.1~~GHVQ01010782.1.p1  ORF type:complete len:188 (-),score=39.73 GHVQ01010782.1:1272-1835(-)